MKEQEQELTCKTQNRKWLSIENSADKYITRPRQAYGYSVHKLVFLFFLFVSGFKLEQLEVVHFCSIFLKYRISFQK
jgi:hypothetical protein